MKQALFHTIACILFCFCLSCSTDEKVLTTQKEITRAEIIMESNPDSALSIMLGINTATLRSSRRMHMEYIMMLANAQNRSDNPMMSLEELLPAMKYFDKEGSCDQRALCLYLAGRICVLHHDSPMAMEYFQRVLLLSESAKGKIDYKTLYRTHCQMAETYHEQKLFAKAAEECMIAAEIALHNDDTLSYLFAKEIAIRPLSMAGRYKEVVALARECTPEFTKRKLYIESAQTQRDALNAYIQCHQYTEARQAMQDYEKHSGHFDSMGRINKGKEMYYYIRGLYYLKTGDAILAEKNFRLLLEGHPDINQKEGAYSGLLQLYTRQGDKDSLGKYAKLYCETHDTVYKRMSTQDVIQIESMYNYERNKLRAEEKSQEVVHLHIYLVIIAFLGAISLFLAAVLMHRRKSIHILEKEAILQSFENEKMKLGTQLEKQKKLAKSYAEQIEQLQKQIQKDINMAEEKDRMIKAMESEGGVIESIRHRGKTVVSLEQGISHEECENLLEYAKFKFPVLWNNMNMVQLGKIEMLTAILLRLKLSDSEIRMCTNTSASAYTNRKNRINRKLFPESNMKLLNENICTLN